jgi:hypothetical protein
VDGQPAEGLLVAAQAGEGEELAEQDAFGGRGTKASNSSGSAMGSDGANVTAPTEAPGYSAMCSGT